ncbi:hypothetical protein KSP35_22245 [Aquihabitans sp. G128]|uniref:hypothetical protein n=1 Tax=Aquihabitans sp. G128 TaxID=2849779 RepID=UPI001C22B417|nr:hypothetical protein [Aquihabitans sp. G128]QXC61000.1 hypothetical protein KSP35_22245 [Aquihabitans sp. G128]
MVVLGTSNGPATARPGRLLLEDAVDPARTEALRALREQARAAPVRVAEDGPRVAGELALDPTALATWLEGLPRDTGGRLANPAIVQALLDGYLASPQLDADDLQALLDHPFDGLWEQDTLRVTLLTPAQYREAYGAIR